MSDESAMISTLRSEIDRLNSRLTQAASESTRRKETLRGVCQALGVANNAELGQVVAELRAAGGYKAVAAEREKLKTASQPGELQSQLEEARGQLRQLKHREGLKGLYGDKDLGLNPNVPVERLETILGYKPDSDDFDARAVREKVAALKTSDPYLFGSDATSQAQSAQPLPWGGRGASGQPVSGPVLTEAQLRDPLYMLSHPVAGK